jgi:uncharacterized protein
MASRPDFLRRQYEFAAHIRDPQHRPAPADVEDRRMAVYRELFYNNVEGFLSGTFPVLRSITAEESWHAMARDFFAHHQSRTPLFLEIPREFLIWLREERTTRADDVPYLYELAHYEWVELALSIAEETVSVVDIDAAGNLLDGIPVLSPLAWHLSYTWPVHRIGPDFQPDAPGARQSCLVVYRNPADEVGFLEINPVTRRLLELIGEERGLVGRELLEQIASELSHPDPSVVISGGSEILNGLRAKSVVLGTRAWQPGGATR